MPGDELLLGGEVCMWAPVEDASNWFQVTFSRSLAVAERLWSPVDVRNTTDALHRGAKLRCRMLSRGLDVAPVLYGLIAGESGDYCPTTAPFHYDAPY